MDQEILKDLLRTKLKIVNSVINLLPPGIRKQAAGFQQSMFKVVNEVAQEFITDKPVSESARADDKGLKSINID